MPSPKPKSLGWPSVATYADGGGWPNSSIIITLSLIIKEIKHSNRRRSDRRWETFPCQQSLLVCLFTRFCSNVPIGHERAQHSWSWNKRRRIGRALWWLSARSATKFHPAESYIIYSYNPYSLSLCLFCQTVSDQHIFLSNLIPLKF